MVNKTSKEKNVNNQVSNNFLIVLILATIIFSTIGTWISLSKLSPLTGLVPAPGIGLVNVTVNASLAFSITPQSVNFTPAMNPGDIDGTTDLTPLPFNVTNDGTVVINVTVKEAASMFTGCSQNTSCLQYACGNTTINGNCSGNHCTTGKNVPCLPNLWNVSTTAQQAISFLDFASANDTVYVHINVTVPLNEPSGAKTATLTFQASQAS
ncbi:hypothetical protein J4455_03575 [Candidatus Woesearchaeota archaeon]|nr:hypothetical protein [Candidatus Woesearchaeota archaeon]